MIPVALLAVIASQTISVSPATVRFGHEQTVRPVI